MAIKQTMNTAIPNDPNTTRAVVNEANDGIKAVPVELVTKANDDSTFTQVSANNGLPVQLTGRNVELIATPFNAFAVTDTDYILSFAGNKSLLSDYKELFLKVASTLDNVGHNTATAIRLFEGSTGFEPAAEVLLTDYFGSTVLITKSDLYPLTVGGLVNLTVAVKCAVAPTIGSITIELYGIPN